MSLFRTALRALRQREENRRWLFVPYDQLTDAVGPLSREPAQELGIVIVECPEKARRRPYHQQKLALLLANLRHFALEQAARGVAVRHVVASSYAAALEPLSAELGALELMRPAERELRAELAPLLETKRLKLIPHEGWLTTAEDFRESQAGPPWRMDAFYRHARRRLGILMERGKPIGGRFSFDAENRQPWHGQPPAPTAKAVASIPRRPARSRPCTGPTSDVTRSGWLRCSVCACRWPPSPSAPPLSAKAMRPFSRTFPPRSAPVNSCTRPSALSSSDGARCRQPDSTRLSDCSEACPGF